MFYIFDKFINILLCLKVLTQKLGENFDKNDKKFKKNKIMTINFFKHFKEVCFT